MDSENPAALRSEIQHLKKRIREAEELYLALDEEHDEELKRLNAQKKELQAKIKKLEDRLFLLEEENADLVASVDQLTKKADKEKAEMGEELQKVRNQKAELEELVNSQDGGSPEKLQEMNGHEAGLLLKHTQMGNQLLILEEENARLEAELTTIAAEERTKMEQERRAIEIEKEDLEHEIAALRQSYGQIEEELQRVRRQKADLEQEITALRETLLSYGQMEEELQQVRRQKAEMEREVAVFRKTLLSGREDEDRRAKDVEFLRDSLKTLSEKNKELQKELDRRLDAEAECTAIKEAAAMIEKENERLKIENARLKKQYVAAESRADENAHILSKATSSAADGNQHAFNRGIQHLADLSNVQSTPRIPPRRLPSLSRNDELESNHRQRNVERRPTLRSTSSTPMSRYFAPSSPPTAISRKRGVVLDYRDSVDRKKFDSKISKLSENNTSRQMDHLKSHYDPSIGAFDQTYGETPAKAAKLTTPKKENKILKKILRR